MEDTQCDLVFSTSFVIEPVAEVRDDERGLETLRGGSVVKDLPLGCPGLSCSEVWKVALFNWLCYRHGSLNALVITSSVSYPQELPAQYRSVNLRLMSRLSP